MVCAYRRLGHRYAAVPAVQHYGLAVGRRIANARSQAVRCCFLPRAARCAAGDAYAEFGLWLSAFPVFPLLHRPYRDHLGQLVLIAGRTLPTDIRFGDARIALAACAGNTGCDYEHGGGHELHVPGAQAVDPVAAGSACTMAVVSAAAGSSRAG